ncbi:MAG: hypothetical protein M1836_005478 [Candelina mexicana]|nr:MAG: hypothetical protein M1836_005478 [Candelina mexicana]
MARRQPEPLRITLIGDSAIIISLAALYLARSTIERPIYVTVWHPRSDIETYVSNNLPVYLQEILPNHPVDSSSVSHYLINNGFLRIAISPEDAVLNASIVQEQGPEVLAIKSSMWPVIERHAPPDCLFWSSTNDIPASQQSKYMGYPGRLVVVRSYNPPHIMPLVEVVPSPATKEDVIERTVDFWNSIGRVPVVLKKECTGFAAYRLEFALLREAIHLVDEGVVTVEEVDTIVQNSMGPRWTVAGPFKSYHLGSGTGGFDGFCKDLGGTVQKCWDESGKPRIGEGQWEEKVFAQTRETYRNADVAESNRVTMGVLEAAEE